MPCAPPRRMPTAVPALQPVRVSVPEALMATCGVAPVPVTPFIPDGSALTTFTFSAPATTVPSLHTMANVSCQSDASKKLTSPMSTVAPLLGSSRAHLRLLSWAWLPVAHKTAKDNNVIFIFVWLVGYTSLVVAWQSYSNRCKAQNKSGRMLVFFMPWPNFVCSALLVAEYYS